MKEKQRKFQKSKSKQQKVKTTYHQLVEACKVFLIDQKEHQVTQKVFF